MLRAETGLSAFAGLAAAHEGVSAGRHGGIHCLLLGSVWNLDDAAPLEDGPAQASSADRLALAFARSGPSLLAGLRGSFALLFWDSGRRQGLVTGDRMGAVAVYHASHGNRLAFATEPALLLRVLPRRPSPSPAAVIDVLGGGGTPGVTTLWEGVGRVPEGSCLHLGFPEPRATPFWEPHFGPRLELSRAELVSGLWQRVEDAVDLRLAHGAHTAIVMSGGLDSATVAAAATRKLQLDDTLTGYSAVFPDLPHVDESAGLNAVASALGLRTIQVRVQPAGVLRRALEYLERWHTGFPGPGYVLEHDLLARAAQENARVALDGQGGDETFSHWPWAAADLLQRGRVLASWRAIREAPGGETRTRGQIFSAWRRVAVKGALPASLHSFFRRRGDPARYAPRWLTPEAAQQYAASTDAWRWKHIRGPRSWAYVVNMVAGAGRTGFAEYFRRRAQPFGIEARPPFLDGPLIDYILELPADAARDLRIDRPLIREALMHLVPDVVRLSNAKSNLSPFYRAGVESDFAAVRRLLEPSAARICAYVKHDHVRSLIESPPQEGQDAWLPRLTQLWNFAGLEAWLRQQEDEQAIGEMLGSWALSEPGSQIHAETTGTRTRHA